MAKCRCGKLAVIEQRYAGKSFCPKCFLKLTENRIRKTVKESNMLKRNDRIAVGYSGGKDSTLLLYYLDKISKKFPLDIVALTVEEGIKGYRKPSIGVAKRFCREHDIEHHIVSFKDLFGFELDSVANKGEKMPCSYCGVFRRKALNHAAKEVKADKLAIGHNLDDEAQVIMMNYLRGDMERSARLGPVSKVRKEFVPRIKPLRMIPEREALAYCLLRELETHDGECPYAHLAFRNEVRELLNSFEEKYPGTKYSIVRGFDKLLPILQKSFSSGMTKCKECGEPCSGQVCKACEYLKTFKSRKRK